jgi:hypothetical protein
MRALILTIALAGCTLPPDRPPTTTEARGLAMLHQLRAADPCESEPTCREVRRGNSP